MNEKEIESYKAGFLNGLDVKENFKLTMFGYDISEILTVMGEYKKKQMDKGVPLGFKFPFKQYEEWNKCCDELRAQGWEIVKNDH